MDTGRKLAVMRNELEAVEAQAERIRVMRKYLRAKIAGLEGGERGAEPASCGMRTPTLPGRRALSSGSPERQRLDRRQGQRRGPGQAYRRGALSRQAGRAQSGGPLRSLPEWAGIRPFAVSSGGISPCCGADAGGSRRNLRRLARSRQGNLGP